MVFGLTDDQRQVQKLFRDFASQEVAPGAQERDLTGAFPYDLVGKLAQTGILGMVFPEDVGGQGGDTVSFVLGLEEISRADQSVAATVANQVGLSALPIATFGTQAQRDRWLPRLFSGDILGAFALTEPGAGSDTNSIVTRATRSDDGWVLDGSKIYITNAGTDITAFAIVAAVTGSRQEGRAPTAAFIVETDNPGYTVGKPLRKMGWRASDTREVFLDGCRVPADALLGQEGVGLRQFLATLEFGRIQIATLGVGLAQAALDAAVAYAEEREQFGRPIAEFQGVAFQLADMAAEVQAARLLTLQAAGLRDEGAAFAKEAAIAKLYASETAMRCAHRCVQIHGGLGFMEESTASRLFRDAKILEIGEGTSEIQRMVIARHLRREATAKR